MLTNIKSTYFIHLTLLYLSEKKKMKLINYNKYLQKLMDRKIIHYRLLSEKTRIYDESKKKGEEYNYEGTLLFKGEFLNGKRNGYGKEYIQNSDHFRYQGEYLNGKRHGKGEEFDGQDYLIFEGEYINGKRNGKGTEYINCVKYEGEFLDGKRNGKGKEYDINGYLQFEGEYLNGLRYKGIRYNPKGKIISRLKNEKGKVKLYNYKDKLIYEGEILNGKKHGKGKEYFPFDDLRFEGIFINDKIWSGKVYSPDENKIYELKNGKGLIVEYTDEKSLIYKGEYLNGERNGKGKEYYCGKLIFEGEYLNGKRNGKGKEYENNQLVFVGEYLNGERNGKGKMCYDALLYEGEFLNNKTYGKAKFSYDGELFFEGEMYNNYMFKGKMYRNKKLKFEGELLFNDEWDGTGYDTNGNILFKLINGKGKFIEFDENGEISFEGELLDGVKNRIGKDYYKGEVVFCGERKNGKRWNGYGKVFDIYDKVDFEGKYIDGKKINEK